MRKKKGSSRSVAAIVLGVEHPYKEYSESHTRSVANNTAGVLLFTLSPEWLSRGTGTAHGVTVGGRLEHQQIMESPAYRYTRDIYAII